MARFIVRRALSAILLLFATSVVVFGIFELIPNYNPARAIAGRNATPDDGQPGRREVRLRQADLRPVRQHDEADLHRPGDRLPGRSQRRRPVQQRFPVTLSLVDPGGDHLAGRCRSCSARSARCGSGRLTDRGLMVLAIVGVSVPIFLLGRAAAVLFAYKLPCSPTRVTCTSATDPDPVGLPPDPAWISIAVLSIGFYSRVLRSNLLDMINQDFVRTARAKGLSERQVFIRHVLRNSLMPIVTLFGLDFAAAARRRRAGHRDRLQPARHRPVRGSGDRQPRRAADPRRRDASPPSSSCCSARSSTSSTPCSTRGSGYGLTARG